MPIPAQRLGKLFNSTVSGLTDGKQLTDDKNIEPCSLIRRFQIIALKDIQLNLTGHSIPSMVKTYLDNTNQEQGQSKPPHIYTIPISKVLCVCLLWI
jgi:hypothetical protein